MHVSMLAFPLVRFGSDSLAASDVFFWLLYVTYFLWLMNHFSPFHLVSLPHPGFVHLRASAPVQNKVCKYKHHFRLQAVWPRWSERRALSVETWLPLIRDRRKWNVETQDDPERRVKWCYPRHFIEALWLIFFFILIIFYNFVSPLLCLLKVTCFYKIVSITFRMVVRYSTYR